MKLRVLIFTFNRPELLERQVKCLKKHLLNDYEIVVIHDSRNDQYIEEFSKICSNLGLQYYYHKSLEGKTPSQYHSESIQWAYDNLIKNEYVEDIVMLLDHDMFLFKELDVMDYLGDYDIAGCEQSRGDIKYIWPGLCIFKTKSILPIDFDFYPCNFFGQELDTGGGTFQIIRTEEIKFKDTGVLYPSAYDDIDLTEDSAHLGYPFELHMDRMFLHSRNASSWHNGMNVGDESKISVLDSILKDFIEL
jgi:glycosyltransferase involved in cell wall biosynthesis